MKRPLGNNRPLTVTIRPAEKQLDTQQIIRILLRGAEYRQIVHVSIDGSATESEMDSSGAQLPIDRSPPKSSAN